MAFDKHIQKQHELRMQLSNTIREYTKKNQLNFYDIAGILESIKSEITEMFRLMEEEKK